MTDLDASRMRSIDWPKHRVGSAEVIQGGRPPAPPGLNGLRSGNRPLFAFSHLLPARGLRDSYSQGVRFGPHFRRCIDSEIAAWDVRRARVFGRCERQSGIAPFDRLVRDVMRRRPYCSAARVFWITDNGSSHRGEASVWRLQASWPNLHLVHTPVHASWLNQIEIYFSIVERKVLTPNDFASLADVADRLHRFEQRYQQIAQPFEWKFTRRDLLRLLARLDAAQPRSKSA